MMISAFITGRTSDVPAAPSDVRYSAESRGWPIVYINNAVPIGRATTNDIAKIVPANLGDECLLMDGVRGWRLVVLTEELQLGTCEEAESANDPDDRLRQLIRQELNRIQAQSEAVARAPEAF